MLTSQMEWDRKDDNVTKQQFEIIQMWRWRKTNINRIAAKLQIPVSMVRVSIKKYKLKAKEVLIRNTICSYKRRKLLDNKWVKGLKCWWQ